MRARVDLNPVLRTSVQSSLLCFSLPASFFSTKENKKMGYPWAIAGGENEELGGIYLKNHDKKLMSWREQRNENFPSG